MLCNFIEIALCRPASLLKKRLWHSCFPVNFAKFSRTPFLQNISGRLLFKRYYGQRNSLANSCLIKANIRHRQKAIFSIWKYLPTTPMISSCSENLCSISLPTIKGVLYFKSKITTCYPQSFTAKQYHLWLTKKKAFLCFTHFTYLKLYLPHSILCDLFRMFRFLRANIS